MLELLSLFYILLDLSRKILKLIEVRIRKIIEVELDLRYLYLYAILKKYYMFQIYL